MSTTAEMAAELKSEIAELASLGEVLGVDPVFATATMTVVSALLLWEKPAIEYVNGEENLGLLTGFAEMTSGVKDAIEHIVDAILARIRVLVPAADLAKAAEAVAGAVGRKVVMGEELTSDEKAELQRIVNGIDAERVLATA